MANDKKPPSGIYTKNQSGGSNRVDNHFGNVTHNHSPLSGWSFGKLSVPIKLSLLSIPVAVAIYGYVWWQQPTPAQQAPAATTMAGPGSIITKNQSGGTNSITNQVKP